MTTTRDSQKSALWEKLEQLAEGPGLRRSDLAHDLGPDLQRIWDIDVNASSDKVFDLVSGKFETVLSRLAGDRTLSARHAIKGPRMGGGQLD